jgi:YHS domain-containing protein
MTRQPFGPAIAIALSFASSIALAQHDAHKPSGAPPDIAPCLQAQPAVEQILTAAAARLESARQTNDPAEMRAAVDQLQGVLRDLKTQLAPCAAAAASASAHAAHGAPASAPDKTIDPVCGMTVDPKTAPSATHEGRTYYFCSAADQKLFKSDPRKYIKK